MLIAVKKKNTQKTKQNPVKGWEHEPPECPLAALGLFAPLSFPLLRLGTMASALGKTLSWRCQISTSGLC